MRHHNGVRKFGRTTNQRSALLSGLALSLIAHGQITTTEAKAKALRRFVEPIITIGKKRSLAARRLVEARLFGNEAAKKVCEDLATRFETRPGGYTRIVRMQRRNGDNAPICQISLVDFVFKAKEKKPSSNKEQTVPQKHDHAHDHEHTHNHPH